MGRSVVFLVAFITIGTIMVGLIVSVYIWWRSHHLRPLRQFGDYEHGSDSESGEDADSFQGPGDPLMGDYRSDPPSLCHHNAEQEAEPLSPMASPILGSKMLALNTDDPHDEAPTSLHQDAEGRLTVSAPPTILRSPSTMIWEQEPAFHLQESQWSLPCTRGEMLRQRHGIADYSGILSTPLIDPVITANSSSSGLLLDKREEEHGENGPTQFLIDQTEVDAITQPVSQSSMLHPAVGQVKRQGYKRRSFEIPTQHMDHNLLRVRSRSESDVDKERFDVSSFEWVVIEA